MQNKLKKHLKKCDEQLDAIFKGFSLSNSLRRQIQGIKIYYYVAVEDTPELIKNYDLLIDTVCKLKERKISVEYALEQINKAAEERKSQVNANIAIQVLSMASLLVIFTFLYFSLCTLVAPCFAINPLFGLVALALCTIIYIEGLTSLIEPLFDFESTLPIKKEKKREFSLVSFFKPAEKLEPSESLTEEKVEVEELLYC